ncbi:hypothetical protein FQV39_05605 [Bosea sp. F3-2]|uniref:hypothetical protein n=1 Tax=Bosea sp. F3-2 TaxID=2599640 RepID=UPI0011ECE817|nr:hypothetical protein [Bosea sp. F3-2]QEL22096.1 hypothetical protein FQV39_05605 [Bosea sp. F3-2]
MGQQPRAAGKKPRVFIWGFPGTNQKANTEDINSERGYGRMSAHMNPVAGNEALVLDAAERFPNFSTYGMNPGFVKTDIRGKLFGGKNWLYHLLEGLSRAFAKSAEGYAEQIVPLLLAPRARPAQWDHVRQQGARHPALAVAYPDEPSGLISRSPELIRQCGVFP